MVLVLPVLASVLLRHDALAALCRATACLIGPDRAHWRALANDAAREGQALLRDAGASENDRCAMTGRHALALRQAPPPCPTTPANDMDITHAWSDACGCDLCVTTGAELVALADARRSDALDHQEALLDAWPCELPSLPWHLDHEASDDLCAAVCA